MEAERTQGFITFPGTSILSAVHAPPPNPHSSSGRTVQQSAYFSYEKTEALEVHSLMKVAQQNRASHSSSLRLTPHCAPAGREDLTCQALGADCFRGGLSLPLCNPSKVGCFYTDRSSVLRLVRDSLGGNAEGRVACQPGGQSGEQGRGRVGRPTAGPGAAFGN